MKNDLQTLARETWSATVAVSARQISLAILASAVVFGVLQIILLGQSVLGGAVIGFGYAAGVTMVAFVLAPLTALFGWLFRGSYNMRPLFCALLLTMFVTLLCKQVLLPLAFLPTVGVLFQILIPLLVVGPSAIGSIASFMTVFPHRFLRFGVGLALVTGVASAYQVYVADIKPGREAFMARVFAEDQPTLAKVLDSGRRPARAITADFTALEREFNAPRGR